MDKNDIIKEFGKLVNISRNAGLDALGDYIEGKRLKNPPENVKLLFDLIDSLNIEQKNQLQKGISFIIDLSFFKFLSLLENTKMPNFRIELKLIESEDDILLIGENEDNELNLKYWSWIKSSNVSD